MKACVVGLLLLCGCSTSPYIEKISSDPAQVILLGDTHQSYSCKFVKELSSQLNEAQVAFAFELSRTESENRDIFPNKDLVSLIECVERQGFETFFIDIDVARINNPHGPLAVFPDFELFYNVRDYAMANNIFDIAKRKKVIALLGNGHAHESTYVPNQNYAGPKPDAFVYGSTGYELHKLGVNPSTYHLRTFLSPRLDVHYDHTFTFFNLFDSMTSKFITNSR